MERAQAARAPVKAGARGKRGAQKQPAAAETEPVTLEGIAGKLERLRWNHALWGVSERQAWHVIERLDEMYRQLLREQQVAYEALLAEAGAQAAGTPQIGAAGTPRMAGAGGSPQQAGRPGAASPAPGAGAPGAASGAATLRPPVVMGPAETQAIPRQRAAVIEQQARSKVDSRSAGTVAQPQQGRQAQTPQRGVEASLAAWPQQAAGQAAQAPLATAGHAATAPQQPPAGDTAEWVRAAGTPQAGREPQAAAGTPSQRQAAASSQQGRLGRHGRGSA